MTLKRTAEKGFTLIEMIVSLGLFSVVVTISVGALLMLVATNQQVQSEQSVMTNLSFALDSMTREIRTGDRYYCYTDNTYSNAPKTSSEYRDCTTGGSAVSFIEGGGSLTGSGGRILYYFNSTEGKIYRRVGVGSPESIVSTGIFIKNLQFNVVGSKPLSVGGSEFKDQASMTIYIEASEKNPTLDPTGKTYYIQTTVSQRTLDI